jgi:hypothetical protein
MLSSDLAKLPGLPSPGWRCSDSVSLHWLTPGQTVASATTGVVLISLRPMFTAAELIETRPMLAIVVFGLAAASLRQDPRAVWITTAWVWASLRTPFRGRDRGLLPDSQR